LTVANDREIVFVTGNAHKVSEAAELLGRSGITVVQKDLGYPEIQADTLEEVALEGIRWCMEKLKKPCFIEDAGLFIEAYRGFPGPYSKYVHETIGNEGVLALMSGVPSRNAAFRSVIAYHDGQQPHLFIGETLGHISTSLAGSHGFGYDPLFVPTGYDLTFAQMETHEKNELSHRGRSLRAFVSYLQKVGE
jgi:XTP/dITP diphosphohydrolase